MSKTSTTTVNRLNGQALVEAFIEDLKGFLKDCPSKSIKGTKQFIVETVVGSSPRLQDANTGNLSRQLDMAIAARCRQPINLLYRRIGDEFEVAMV